MALALLIALLVIAGAGVYTYARYQTSRTGTGDVVIAKWAAAIKQDGTAVSDNFELALTPVANNNVASGKIAPGSSATATLVLDLTGTEVATDYEVEIGDVTGLPAGMTITGITADGNSLTKTGNVYKGSVALNNEKTALVDEEITLVITVTWENNESNNSTDTTAGEGELAARTKSIPVTVTAKQHIDA